MTALENTGGDLVPFKGQMIARADIPRSSRVKPVALETMDDALRYAKVIAASGLLPASFLRSDADPTAAAFVAIQLGAEVGLSPMASVQNIAVINGKPGLYGPAMLAVVEASGKLENFEEWIEGDSDNMVAYCKCKRFGRPERVTSFSWDDAKKALLIGKRGPWTEYPKRMMQARARSFALRDMFPDVLAGLSQSVEELRDIPAEQARDVTPTKVEPPARPADTPPPPPRGPKPAIKVKVPGGWDPVQFSQDDGLEGALRQAMEFMTGAIIDGGPTIVSMNNKLLDRIAEVVPDMADEVSELRAAAAEALKPADEDETQDTFVSRFINGDDPDPDDFPGDRPSAGT
jgi:hypothetical protein